VSANDEILNALTRHQIFVLRYARGRENQAADFITRLLAEVAGSIKSAKTEFQLARAQQQAADLYQYAMALQLDNRNKEFEEWINFAEYEAEFNADLLNDVRIGSALPTRGQLVTAMNTSVLSIPGSPGYSMRRLLESFDDSVINQIRYQIQDATALGYTNQQLARNILDLEPTLGRRAATVARTATNHVSNQTRKLSMQENDDVLEGYEWVATLDARTSLVCAARDGVIYRDFEKDPKPPAHFNCRSTITMRVKPEFDLGPGTGTRPNRGPAGARNLPASITFGDWLHSQPRPFQEKILGKTRAKLFRDGKFTLDKFVDSQGNVLTLRELGLEDVTFNNKKPPPPPIVNVEADDFGMAKINASGLSSADLNLSLSRLSPDLKDLVQKLPKPKRIKDAPTPDEAWYEPWSGTIAQGSNSLDEVFRHEYGHHIDRMLGTKLSGFSEEASQLPRFIKAFEADRKAMGLQKAKERGPMLNDIFKDLYYKGTIELEPGVTTGKWFIKSQNHGMISDIIDAMTHGYCYSSLSWFGHGRKYYKDKRMRYMETFANLFALKNDPVAWSVCQKRFPKLIEVFEQLIKDGLTL